MVTFGTEELTANGVLFNLPLEKTTMGEHKSFSRVYIVLKTALNCGSVKPAVTL
jgi:hypothetical protein